MKKLLTITALAILLFNYPVNAQYYEFANTHSYGFMDEYPTRIKGIVVDALGRLIVAGDYQRTQFGNDRSFINLPSGSLVLIPHSPYGYVLLNSITTDGVGNVYLTGYSADYDITFGSITLTNPAGGIPFLVKFDVTGKVVYAKKKTNLFALSVNSAGTILYATDWAHNYKINATTGSTSLTDNVHRGTPLLDANGNEYVYQSDSLFKLSKSNFSVLWKRYAPGISSFYTGNTNDIYLVFTNSIQKYSTNNVFIQTYNTGGNYITKNSTGQFYIFRSDGLHKYNSGLTAELWHFDLPPFQYNAQYGEHEIYIAGQFDYTQGLLLCPFQLSPYNLMVSDNVGFSAKITDEQPAPFQAHIACSSASFVNELCEDQSISVPFSVCANSSSQFAVNNAFYVQLSDASGDFTNAINIGPPNNAVIPDTIPTGYNYKTRVNSTNPPIIGDAYPDVFAQVNYVYGYYIHQFTSHISAVGPTGLCVNGSVKIKSDSAVSYYNWYIDGVYQDTIPSYQDSIVVTSPCAVYCEMGGGCYKKSNTVYVTNSIPTAPILAFGATTFCAGDSVKLATNNCTGCTYQWKKNGAKISGATSYQYIARVAGNFKVIVTGSNGCTKASAQKTITVNCRETGDIATDATDNAILLYPDPAKDQLHIDCAVTKGKATLIIKNILGQEIYRKTVEATDDGLSDDINIKELSEGIYVLSVYAGGEIYSGKFIKE